MPLIPIILFVVLCFAGALLLAEWLCRQRDPTETRTSFAEAQADDRDDASR